MLLRGLLPQRLVKALQEAAEDEADMDEPGVETHLHQQLCDVRDEQSDASWIANLLAVMVNLVFNRQILSRPLTYPQENPNEQVHKLDNLKAFPLLFLLEQTRRDHDAPDDEKFEDDPDEDEEEDGLGQEADV